jgi:hypothetical protein
MNPYSKRALETHHGGALLRATHGVKTLVWEPHVQLGSTDGVRAWMDFLQQDAGHNSTVQVARSQPTNNLILSPRPWMHIAGDSVTSSLAPVMVAWFGDAHHHRAAVWRHFVSYSTYKCTGFKPFEYDSLPAMSLSYMNWVNKGANGTSARPAHILLRELGLSTCASHLLKEPTSTCLTGKDGGGPDVLLLGSGPWELQDREPESFAVEVAQLLPVLRRLLPHTRLLVLGPLGQYLSPEGEAVRSWRTQHRAMRLSRALRHVVSRQGDPSVLSFLDLSGPLAAIGHSHTVDGTHFLGESILDVVNMLLNELLNMNWIHLGN